MKALHLVLAGRVQGVGFRYFTRRLGRELGLRGWVRNLPDGRVEIEVGGEPQAVADFVAGVRQGPPGAHVSTVEEEDLFPVPAWDSWDGFEIVR